jgi:translation initiation factor IF-3
MFDNRYNKFPQRSGGYSSFPPRRDGTYTPRPRPVFVDPLEREFPRNNAITAPQVRVVHMDGTGLGIMDTKDAIARAQEEDLDLVLIAPKAEPPVCKIIGWDSFKYQHKKKEKEMRKKQKTIKVKEIKLSPKIAGGDLDRKIEKILEVTNEGDQAKITIMKKWRLSEENIRTFKENLLTKLEESCTIINVTEKGKNIFILVKSKIATDAKAQN